MSPKTFTPGPGYPMTDFINVERPPGEVEQLRRDRDELLGVCVQFRDQFEDAFQEGNDIDWRACGSYAESLGALLARIRGAG